MSVLLIACIVAVVFAVFNGVIATIRWLQHRKKVITEIEEDLSKAAGRRDAFDEIAKFADEYFDESDFGNRIRTLYYSKQKCPVCLGKGKKWTNSSYKCSNCWGTGKKLER